MFGWLQGLVYSGKLWDFVERADVRDEKKRGEEEDTSPRHLCMMLHMCVQLCYYAAHVCFTLQMCVMLRLRMMLNACV